MARFRNRTAPVDEGGEIREAWMCVETQDGNAAAGVDGVFDHDTESGAETAVQNLAVEIGKPLSVVVYTREVLSTYAAVTKIEKVS
jgi:hypothetical protein